MCLISICSWDSQPQTSYSHISISFVLLFHLDWPANLLLFSDLVETSSQFPEEWVITLEYLWNKQLKDLFPLNCSCRTFNQNLELYSQAVRSYLNWVKYLALTFATLCFYFLELEKALLSLFYSSALLISSSAGLYSVMIFCLDLPSSSKTSSDVKRLDSRELGSLSLR